MEHTDQPRHAAKHRKKKTAKMERKNGICETSGRSAREETGKKEEIGKGWVALSGMALGDMDVSTSYGGLNTFRIPDDYAT